jgi:hypothetical protein
LPEQTDQDDDSSSPDDNTTTEPEPETPEEPTEPETPEEETEPETEEPETPEEETPTDPEPEQPEDPVDPEPTPEEEVTEPSEDNIITEEEVAAIVDDALADGELTAEEKVAVIAAILDSVLPGEAVSAELIKESGIDLADLPPDTPIELANGVVITAEVGNAFETLANPAELIGAIFSDPGQVLLALGNLGADMSEEEREESQEVVVAAVIVTGIAVQSAVNAAASAATAAAASAGGGPSGGGSKGGGAGGPAAPRNDAGAPIGKEGGTKPKKTVKKQNKIKPRRRPK